MFAALITLHDIMNASISADQTFVARLPRSGVRRRLRRRFTISASSSNVGINRTASLRNLLAQPGILLVRLLSALPVPWA
jgi:limonene-1,2-epoxide hydrolase